MANNTEVPREAKPGQEPKGPPRHRSPNYPALSLEKAVERAKDVYDAYKQVQVPITAIHAKWGCKPKSGLVLQTIAALNAYGLIEVSGSKDKRMIRLTDVAVKIVRDHPGRQGLLQTAALNPPVYAELWDKYKADGIPPDDILSNYLEWDKKFNPKAIAGFITDFRATIDFAKLAPTGTIDADGDGDETALETEDEKPPKKSVPETPPPKPKGAELPRGGPNMSTDVLTLDVGTVTLQCPRELHTEDYQALEDWIGIQLRLIKRRVKNDLQNDNKQQATQTE
jgi:hypothetical protein